MSQDKKSKLRLKIPAPLTEQNISQMAEMWLSDREKWQTLEPEKRDLLKKDILRVLDIMLKIGYEPRPAGEFRKHRKEKIESELEVARFLLRWIREHISVPKNLDKLFPCGELAVHFCKTFDIKKKVDNDPEEKS